ncbi:MAG: carboxypeptidase regulatory-like domain-containing protein [Gemmatimonadetes bacterium]|nr:carboxypeptidase regulatory-like domain-containing protein [Gemmatimonadota bacterium]
MALAALTTGFAAPVAAAQHAASGVLRGDVTDTAGVALQGARVGLPGIGLATRSDARGHFAIANVHPGRYELVASMIGRMPVGDSIVVRSGETTWVKLVMRQPPVRVETLPPRVARGTRPDTAPAGAETIDRIARVARLPALRPRPADTSQRELRIWLAGGRGIPMQLLRITNDGGQVRGEVILWLVQTIPDRKVDPEWRAFIDSVPTWLRDTFHCGRVSTDTTRSRDRDELVAVCRVQFGREPDWRAALVELERHHVWNLPDASELPVEVTRREGDEDVVILDGVGVTVETWNGTRYRAYTIGNPDRQPFPEYRDAWAILRLVVAFPATHSAAARQ